MTVRTLQHDDLPALLDLYTQLNDEPRPQAEAANAAWSEALQNPRCRYFGAFAQDQLISTCTVMIIPNLTRAAQPYALIENVVTHRDHRQRGHGTAVLQAALGFAWSSGCYKAMLMTGRRDEAVLRFYENAGFSRHDKQAFIARKDR